MVTRLFQGPLELGGQSLRVVGGFVVEQGQGGGVRQRLSNRHIGVERKARPITTGSE
jgi:hypothetical protein